MDKVNATKRLTNKLYGFSGVYMITIKEHSYIGSTKNFRNRWKQHLARLNQNNHVNSNLQNAYNKFGRENMFFCILEKCNENLLQREKHWIDILEPDLNINRDPTLIDNSWQYNTNGKTVYQYDFNGNFIKEYKSTKDAGRILNINPSKISASANSNIKQNKSAGGYIWSYIKLDNPQYVNHSKDAKSRKVCLFDIITGEEYKFNSSADAARTLFKNENIASISALIISSCCGRNIIRQRYIAKYQENENYIIPQKCLSVININTHEILNNRKILYKKYNLSQKRLAKNKDWLSLTVYAVLKLRESGKTISDGNPNPSAVEIQ